MRPRGIFAEGDNRYDLKIFMPLATPGTDAATPATQMFQLSFSGSCLSICLLACLVSACPPGTRASASLSVHLYAAVCGCTSVRPSVCSYVSAMISGNAHAQTEEGWCVKLSTLDIQAP